jgi:3-phosphoshikimate 1-carboxyvinyltransferase
VRALGATVEEEHERDAGSDLVLSGVGLHGARELGEAVDVGNAGTLLRLLPGWLAGQAGRRWTLDGDESIRRRPVDRIAEPLRGMGAELECRDGRLPPLAVAGAELHGIRYELPVASAQVKSCVLLAGLLASGETVVVERHPSRDHTERMLARAGAPVRREDGETAVGAVERLELGEVAVAADFSSAAFFLVAAALVPGSELRLRAVNVNPTRTGLLAVLERMGASVELIDERERGGEPAADLLVRGGDELRGANVEAGEVPLLIDELPLVALAGALARGTTSVRGAEELRHKESDRIATVVEGLRALGARIEATPDGFVVVGEPGSLRGGVIDAHGDHRLAMLGAVAGAASREGVEVRGFEAAGVSYPGFAQDLRRLVANRFPRA